jgi:protein phosphatase
MPDFWVVPAVVGDRFLICSDGLTGEVEPSALAELARRTDPPQQVADRMVAAAIEAGGRDNVTVVVVDVVEVASSGEVLASPAAADLATGELPPAPDSRPFDTRPFTPLTRRNPQERAGQG